MADLVATCVWRADADLILALDRRLGEPTDSYVNGSQVWLRDDGPGAATLEWRLHPVAGYTRPAGLSTAEVFPAMAMALASALALPAPLATLWDGLEVFSAFDVELEPVPLAAAASATIGTRPQARGLADHRRIGDQWEACGGRMSIIEALIDQLTT